MSLLDRINETIGRLVSWLTLLMVINTIIVIIGRDFFDFGRIWLQEITTWMHATVFLLAAGYTLKHDEHVRVDIFYHKLGERGRAWVDLVGVIVLLMPVCGFILVESWDYVFGPRGTWASIESSRQAGGLGYPAPSILKTFMLLMPVLLMLQGISMMLAAWRTIRARSHG